MKKAIILILILVFLVGCQGYFEAPTGLATGNQVTNYQFDQAYGEAVSSGAIFTQDGNTFCFELGDGSIIDDRRTGGTTTPGRNVPTIGTTPPTGTLTYDDVNIVPGYVDLEEYEKAKTKELEPIKWGEWCYDDPEHPLYGFGCSCGENSDCDNYGDAVSSASLCAFKDSKFPSEGKVCTITCVDAEGLSGSCPYVNTEGDQMKCKLVELGSAQDKIAYCLGPR